MIHVWLQNTHSTSVCCLREGITSKITKRSGSVINHYFSKINYAKRYYSSSSAALISFYPSQ
jgi:hypothetical protein